MQSHLPRAPGCLPFLKGRPAATAVCYYSGRCPQSCAAPLLRCTGASPALSAAQCCSCASVAGAAPSSSLCHCCCCCHHRRCRCRRRRGMLHLLLVQPLLGLQQPRRPRPCTQLAHMVGIPQCPQHPSLSSSLLEAHWCGASCQQGEFKLLGLEPVRAIQTHRVPASNQAYRLHLGGAFHQLSSVRLAGTAQQAPSRVTRQAGS